VSAGSPLLYEEGEEASPKVQNGTYTPGWVGQTGETTGKSHDTVSEGVGQSGVSRKSKKRLGRRAQYSNDNRERETSGAIRLTVKLKQSGKTSRKKKKVITERESRIAGKRD